MVNCKLFRLDLAAKVRDQFVRRVKKIMRTQQLSTIFEKKIVTLTTSLTVTPPFVENTHNEKTGNTLNLISSSLPWVYTGIIYQTACHNNVEQVGSSLTVKQAFERPARGAMILRVRVM